MIKKTKLGTYITGFDQWVFLSYLFLCVIGLLVMLDISAVQEKMSYFNRHLAFMTVSVIACLLILYFADLEKLKFFIPFLSWLAIALLVVVLFKGKTINGATRQINIGPFSFQPSFFARIVLVMFYALKLSEKHEKLRESTNPIKFAENFPALTALTIAIFFLIYKEKHLSTILISAATLAFVLYYAGIRHRVLLPIILIGVVGVFFVLSHGESFRANRMSTYKKYNPLAKEKDIGDITGSDRQVRESLVALTSGGLFGTGIARGRAKHFYLSEVQADYVYTIIGEEGGFLGAMFVFVLHSIIFFSAFRIAERQKDMYLKLLAAGMALNIYCNVLLNTGVAMSLLPSTGNTLPFISYGGSALMMDSIALGIILNISAKRRTA